MTDRNRTKEQLIEEIRELRLQLARAKKTAVNRQRDEKKLKASENKYRALFDNATDAIYLIDSATQKIIDCNPRASALIGYRTKELKTMTLADLHPTEEQDVVFQIFNKLAEAGSLSGISNIHQRKKDGTLMPVEINAAILEIDNKTCYLALIRDITLHRQAVSDLKKSEEKYRALFKHMFIGCALHRIIVDKHNTPIDYEFLEINDSFERLTGLKRAKVIGKKITDIVPGIRKEKPDLISIYGDVALKGEAAKFEVQFKPFNKWYSISAYSPMKGYFVALFDDVTLRKYWEEKISQSELKYRRFFENAYDSVFIIDPDSHRILDINQNAAKRLGYTREELLQMKIDDLDPPSDAGQSGHVTELQEKSDVIFEHVHRRKDGTLMQVEISSRLIRYGENRVIESFVRDITKRKKAEETLQESEKRFRDISENAMEWIWEVDVTGHYTYVNRAVEKILGYRPEEVLKKHFYDLFHPDDREELKRAAFEVFTSKKPFRQFINRNIHKNGDDVWLSTSGIPLLDSSGNLLGYRGADIDITAIKKGEESLRESEIKARAISDSSLDAIVMMDARGVISYFNDSAEAIFGYRREEIIGRNLHDVLVSKKSRREYYSRLPEFEKTGQCIVIGKRFDLKATKKDGTEFPIELSISAFKSKGQWHAVGTVKDITARKKMEKRLEEAALTDDLTGLLNRRGFYTLAEQMCRMADRSGRGLSLLFADLDNMKEINDELGHEAGDQALHDMAEILKKTFRKSDIIARMGGDEFAVVITEPSHPDIENIIVKNLIQNITKHNGKGLRMYALSLSTGIANYDPEKPCSVSDLLTRADAAMYINKKHRKAEKDTPSSATAATSERREHSRYVNVHGLRADLDDVSGLKIKDISLGGICLQAPETFNVKGTCIINIIRPDKKRLTSDAVAVWSRTGKTAGTKEKKVRHFEAGFKFINISDDSQSYLKKCIRSLARER